MNTAALLLLHPEPGVTTKMVEEGFAAAERTANEIEDIFSRFRPASELSRLNDAAGRRTTISPLMAEVLGSALELHRRTGGLFDPAILPALEHAGYDRTFESLPTDRIAPDRPPPPRMSFGDIELSGREIRIPEEMQIDLGGIVKGWAADRLSIQLGALGPCLVELGGDTAVHGVPPDTAGWSVGVQSADRTGEIVAIVEMAKGGVATSGTQDRKWRVDGAWVHHVIDPRTGEPAVTDLRQVTAFGPNALAAEVWAKAVLIAGSAAAGQVVQGEPDIQLILIPLDGPAVASSGVPFVLARPSRG